jgi:hypothetical protein
MKQVANQTENSAKKNTNTNTNSNSKETAGINYFRKPYNIGTLDRALRFFLGAALIGSVFYINPEYVLSLAGMELKLYKLLPLVGIYPAITAWLGWDPIYQLARIKSDTPSRGDVCDDLITQTKTLAQH